MTDFISSQEGVEYCSRLRAKMVSRTLHSAFFYLVAAAVFLPSQALVVTLCAQDDPVPLCNTNCASFHVSDRECLPDPHGGSWRVQCMGFPQCFFYSETSGSCGGDVVAASQYPCNMCQDQNVTACNETSVIQKRSCDSACRNCAYELVSHLGECTSIGQQNFLTIGKHYSHCKMAAVFATPDNTQCNGRAISSVQGSGNCFIASRNEQVRLINCDVSSDAEAILPPLPRDKVDLLWKLFSLKKIGPHHILDS